MTMMDGAESGRRLPCALFVDFDNVYIGLQRLDPGAIHVGMGGRRSLLPMSSPCGPGTRGRVPSCSWFVWDPKRFSEADLPSAGAVDLPVERYRVLLTAPADDLSAAPFVRTETSKRVRDACQAAGAKIGRASVNTVIAGVLYAGLDLMTRPTAMKVAETWADNVIGLCRGARMELGQKDVTAIRAWVGGGLLKK
jgi:hypothetical protein